MADTKDLKSVNPVVEEREVKATKAKLLNLSPLARAEVVNEVVNKQVGKQVNGFMDFLREQGIVGIGIGLVLGIQVKSVVDQIMVSFVNPFTTLFLPGKQTLNDQVVTVHLGGKSAEIGWGPIVYSLFTLLMVAVIVYAGFKLLKLDKLTKKKDEDKPKPKKKK